MEFCCCNMSLHVFQSFIPSHSQCVRPDWLWRALDTNFHIKFWEPMPQSISTTKSLLIKLRVCLVYGQSKALYVHTPRKPPPSKPKAQIKRFFLLGQDKLSLLVCIWIICVDLISPTNFFWGNSFLGQHNLTCCFSETTSRFLFLPHCPFGEHPD